MKRIGWFGAAAMTGVLLLSVPFSGGTAYAGSQKVDADERRRWGGRHGDANSNDPGIEQRAGIAYFSKSEVKAFDAHSGSVEFVVKRLNAGGDYGPLLRFEDSEGEVLVEIAMNWNSPRAGGSSLHILGSKYRPDVWGQDVDLGREVAVGEVVTITMTWGNGPAENRVYLNGTEARAYLMIRAEPKARVSSQRGGNLSAVVSGAASMGVTSQAAVKRLTPGVLNEGDNTELLSATFYDEILVPGAEVNLEIASVEHDVFLKTGFSQKLIAGNSADVTLLGTAGATGTFDVVHLPDVSAKIPLNWKGWGVYLEDKVFYEAGEVNLRDVTEYQVFASTTAFDPAAPGMEPVVKLKVEEQSYTLEFLQIDQPYYVAVVAAMRDGTLHPVISPIRNVPLLETNPGEYSGTFTVGWQDRYPRAAVVGRLTSGTVSTHLLDLKTFVVDPTLTIAITTDTAELPADEKSIAKIKVTVTDANGNPVAGHKVKYLLATTSQYTGVIGGGAFAEGVGGKLTASPYGETDLFGTTSATYVAGFAAKTAIVVVRDMLSNDTASSWVKTYIQATASLVLEPVTNTAASMQRYEITVTSSDEWLTADGKSQARISALVTLGGNPVEGHKVGFKVDGGGSVRAVADTTGRDGVARAVYTAGKKIGIAIITATDLVAGISGTVSIELRSDAPAKIAIKLDPTKLFADGRSRADLSVQVTDINDNPNENTEVEYAIASGSGSLRDKAKLTDRNGESSTTFTAGRTPGTVTFEITVRSAIPTETELQEARALALAVTDYKFF